MRKIWLPTLIETGEPDCTNYEMYDNPEDYELIDTFEWRQFALVPIHKTNDHKNDK